MKTSIADLSAKIRARTAFLRSGAGLTILVIGLVGLRLGWIQLERPAHEREIAAAFGSGRMFYGLPQLNHNGTQFTYVATSDHGYSLFLCDAATGRKQTICEESTIGLHENRFRDLFAWPWSSDDTAFAYSLHDKLVIQSVDTNKAPVELNADIDSISDLVWLNPAEFVYLSYRTNLCLARKGPDGQWQQQQLLQGNGITALTAADTNTVAWLEGGLICRLDPAAALAGTNNSPAAPAPDTNNPPPAVGLKLWLDASTLNQDDQTAVPVLKDLSSSVNDAVANGTPPTYNGPESSGALNGKGTIHFTSAGNATGLKTRANLGITGNTPRTVFAVMRHDAGGVMRINLGDYGARFGYFGLEEEDRFLSLPRLWNRWSNRVAMRLPSWSVLGVVYDGSGQRAYINGMLGGTNHVGVDTVDKEVEIGFRSAKTNAAGADGDFAELMIYDRALGADERQRVEDYLKTKWLGNNLLSSKSPLVWVNPPMQGLAGFAYSRDGGQFLLNTGGKKQNTLWRYDPASGQAAQVEVADSIQNAQWIGKDSCAYIATTSGQGSVVLADASGGRKETLPVQGDIRWFQATPDGKRLLILGTFSNDPAEGIWQYDIASRQLQPMVSYSDYPSVYARNVARVTGTLKLASGRSVKYTTYPPANFNSRKKYPLLIGYTHFGTVSEGGFGRLQLPAIAACGAYVVVVDRASWDNGIEQWGDMVTGACEELKRNPNIDFNRVYVFGASKETSYLSDCIAKSPGLWKGAILLNPSMLPDFSQSPLLQQRPKILISAGGEEHEEDRVNNYQEESLKSGVIVDVAISPGEGHFFVGNAAQLDRTKAMINFIFEE